MFLFLQCVVFKQLPDHWDAGSVLPLTLSLDLSLNGLTDGQLARPLADLGQISARKAVRDAGQIIQIHVLTGNREKRLGDSS